MTNKLYDRGGMNVTTIGSGTTLTLGSALGAVAPNVCSFQDFPTAGAQNGDPLRVLLLDTNGGWEISTFTFSSSGPSLTGRTVEASSNGGSPISLTGSCQAFIMAGAGDLLTAFNGRGGGPITPQSGDYTIASNTIALPQSYLAGLQLSNDATTPNTVLDITAGQARDSANATNIVLVAFAKSTGGSWVAGSGANGMGNGLTVAASTWYHVFAIINSGAADIYFDTSVTAANAPAGTTAFRRIGSIKTDASSHILAFKQYGENLIWASIINEINTSTPSTSITAISLIGVPPGVSTRVMMRGLINGTTPAGALIVMSADETVGVDGDPTGRNRTLEIQVANVAFSGHFDLRTNTSGQIKYQAGGGSNLDLFNLQTIGYSDSRGRDT